MTLQKNYKILKKRFIGVNLHQNRTLWQDKVFLSQNLMMNG